MAFLLKEVMSPSGILDHLEPGDSVMVDREFDIQDILILHHVHLNIPPFMHGKTQLPKKKLVITTHIAWFRIHAKQEIERITCKCFHILIGYYQCR